MTLASRPNLTRPTSLVYAAGMQMRVIGALMMREIYSRYGRDNLGFLWTFGEPLMFIGGVFLVRHLIQKPVDNGIPLMVLVSTGYPPLVMWRHCIARSINGMRQNYPLLYHRQVLPVDIVWARNLVEVIGVLLATLLCYVFLLTLGAVHMPVDFAWFLLGWGFHIWFAIGTGFVVGATSEMTVAVEKVVPVIGYLWMPIGGCFYLVDWLPYKFWPICELIPSVDAYEIMRQGYWGNQIPAHYNMTYLALSCFVWLFLGMAMVKFGRRRMEFE